MDKYNLQELQEHLLNLLTDIDKAFQENGLTYYLAYGTMLGAVRHGGFIPWDDDIDIAMPRPDYERLIQHAQEYLPSHLEFKCAETDSDYPFAFGKIQDNRTTLIERPYYPYLGGIYCDIFPIDGIPAGTLRRKIHFLHYYIYYRLLYIICKDPYKHGHGPSCWLPLLCRRIYSLRYVQQKIRKILLKYDYESCPEVRHFYGYDIEILPKRIFSKPCRIKFGGKFLNAVCQQDEYLKTLFGEDYMTIPPQEKRHRHLFHFLDLATPYSKAGILGKGLRTKNGQQ